MRVFEAAARHGSFVAAAGELSISRGAVSRTIRQLELFMGVELFWRGVCGVCLTQIGREYAQAVSPAIGQIAHASRAIRRNSQSQSSHSSHAAT
ncbi:MAG TPA: LysR family transcriptional regulator [Steroidobacteraceae bacterium]|nr:LysR family transcriptional regulator [Steroidobacteraceae bacterium]